MAKRKKRKSSAPNLPDEVLERARKQLDGTLEEEEAQADSTGDTPDVPEEEAVAEPAAEAEAEPAAPERPVMQTTRTTTARSSRRRERRERRSSATSSRSSSTAGGPTVVQRNKSGELDNEQIAHLLANPTKVVSEEQLHEEYGYVLRDLRNMAVLAVALMVVLVLLAQLI